MEDGTLQHARKTQRRLGVTLLFRGGQNGCGLFDEGFKFLTQRHQVHGTRFKRLAGRGVAEQRQQQVLDGHELMTVLARSGESHV